MSAAPVLETRRKVVAALRADSGLLALVPAAQIFGEKSQSSSWPFLRCSEFEGEPLFRVIGNVHAFSRTAFADEAHQLIEAAGNALDGAVLVLADGRKAHVRVTSSRMLADPEESTAWHGILSIAAEIPKDCTGA